VTQTVALSREERITELWRRGRLRWKLYEDQREVYDRVHAFLDDSATRFEAFYLDISRQWGKTFLGALLADEFARNHDGARIGYTSYTRVGLRQFVHPNYERLWLDCPAELRPDWSLLDSSYHYGNGSMIHLAGANNGHEDDSRGPKADLLIVEEAAFIDRLDYLVQSVLVPQLSTTGGRLIFISTPPETPAHEVSLHKAKCQAKGNYIRRTIDDNRHLSQKAKDKLITEAGGRQSTAARRELWCEWVVDETRAVVPEFTDARAEVIVQPAPAPTFEPPLASLDVGFEDWSHCLFGFYKFDEAKLIVQAETRLRRMRTDELADAVKVTEARLWKGYAVKPRRVSDVDLILLHDMASLHNLHFAPIAKDEKEAMVNELRLWIQSGRIVIDPSCEHLIRQLKTAIWNKARTSFERTASDGHFDAVDALVYMVRSAPVHHNPYPALAANITAKTHTIQPEAQRANEHTEKAIKQLFNIRKRRTE
jgi:hypothetical protein